MPNRAWLPTVAVLVAVAAAIAGDTTTAGASAGTVGDATHARMSCPAPRTAASPGAPAISDQARSGVGTVNVAVPRLTIIRIVDGRLVVSANSVGGAPDPDSDVYVVNGNRARLASVQLREQVLNECR